MKKRTVTTLLISLAAAALMAALAFLVCYVVNSVKESLSAPAEPTTVTTEPLVSTTVTKAPPETTVSPETSEPPETTTPPETTVPPTTEEPTAPPTTEAPTAPPTTEPEETWIPTEPPVTDPPETEPAATEPPVTEPEVKFEDVNETVYTSNNATIHTGPGFTYKTVKALDKGTELLRTGIGENGWSRVIYNGKTYYIYTKKLTKNKPVDEPEPTEAPEPTDNPYYAGDGKYYCPHCGKISGDGSNGTCLRYFMTGFDCPCCGVYVPAQVCHTCGEDS